MNDEKQRNWIDHTEFLVTFFSNSSQVLYEIRTTIRLRRTQAKNILACTYFRYYQVILGKGRYSKVLEKEFVTIS